MFLDARGPSEHRKEIDVVHFFAAFHSDAMWPRCLCQLALWEVKSVQLLDSSSQEMAISYIMRTYIMLTSTNIVASSRLLCAHLDKLYVNFGKPSCASTAIHTVFISKPTGRRGDNTQNVNEEERPLGGGGRKLHRAVGS